MSNDGPAPTRDGHPIVWGLVSMVAVGAIIAGILGGGAFVASKALGLTESDGVTTASTTGGGETMVVPDPTETDREPTDYITLRDVPEPKLPKSTYSETPDVSDDITLEAGSTSVAPMAAIDLNGSYPAAGDGTVLQVERWEGGAWTTFPVTATVAGGEFYTYVKTGSLGETKFRVVDTETDKASNEVVVTIG